MVAGSRRTPHFAGSKIPQMMQDLYANPALTPEVIAKVFGPNADAVYGVDPKVLRQKIKQDASTTLCSRAVSPADLAHTARIRVENIWPFCAAPGARNTPAADGGTWPILMRRSPAWGKRANNMAPWQISPAGLL